MSRLVIVHCACKRLVFLKRMRAWKPEPGEIGKPPILFGAVCECGRGMDLRIEREPANEARG